MSSYAPVLVSLLAERRPYYVEVAPIVIGQNPEVDPGRYTQTDLAQFVGGIVACMTEALEERGRETIDFYLGSVIPAVIAAGETLASVNHASIGLFVYIAGDVAEHCPHEHRGECMRWLSKFCADYVAAVTRTALTVISGETSRRTS
jgi:hypothetical protein